MAKLSAHRGGPEGRSQPNALATIEAACTLGVDLIEFDVQLDAAGDFVIGHDRPSALRLREVLAVISGRAQAHVDLKCDRAEVEVVDLCVEVLGPDGFIVTTGRPASVRRLRAARPDIVVGLSVGRFTQLFPWRRLRRCDASFVAAHYRLARLGVLAGAARRRLPVLVWTLNREAQLRAAQRDDRIWIYTTDYPRLALRLAAETSETSGSSERSA
jgi:glycerophosphoryl diester phosphodiesterase